MNDQVDNQQLSHELYIASMLTHTIVVLCRTIFESCA